MDNENQTTPGDRPTKPFAEPSGSPAGHVKVRFLIVQRPGKAPYKKGPLAQDMVTPFLQSHRKYFPAATLTVAEFVQGDDLWLTSESDWLACCPPAESENKEVSGRLTDNTKTETTNE